jgi:hypothetical protein
VAEPFRCVREPQERGAIGRQPFRRFLQRPLGKWQLAGGDARLAE